MPCSTMLHGKILTINTTLIYKQKEICVYENTFSEIKVRSLAGPTVHASVGMQLRR